MYIYYFVSTIEVMLVVPIILKQELINIKRDIKKDLECEVVDYKIFCVNANYALNNHYVGIGVAAHINGKPKNLVPEDWEKWEWFNKNSVPKNLFPATKNLIESYLKKKVNVCE